MNSTGGTPADTRSGADLRVLDGIAGWCGGLHGSMPLSQALRALAVGLNADAAVISRHHHRNEDRPRAVAAYDSHEGTMRDTPLLRRAFCQDSLGYMFNVARASTIWFLSDLLDDPAWSATTPLLHWRYAREISEIVTISLAASHQQNDYIEFHFGRVLPHSERLELEALVPTIVRSWSGRQPGLVTEATMDRRIEQARRRVRSQRPGWDAPILGMSNPARLSRAEFRVCLLLSRGLSVKGVTEELGLSENTVRSHLRAIYAKTETSSLAELLYRILSSGRDSVDVASNTA